MSNEKQQPKLDTRHETLRRLVSDIIEKEVISIRGRLDEQFPHCDEALIRRKDQLQAAHYGSAYSHLVWAAPDLLVALQNLVEQIQTLGVADRLRLDAVEAALDKTTGENHYGEGGTR